MASFEDQLRALGKRRIRLPELRAAWLRAHPEARDQPEQRRLLLDALRGLEREGIVNLPGRRWDTSGSPALPRTASLRNAAQSRRTRSPQAWLPALAFAADERHPVRRADLRAVNAFLLSERRQGARAGAHEGAIAADIRGREAARRPAQGRALPVRGAHLAGRSPLLSRRPSAAARNAPEARTGPADPGAGELSLLGQLPPVEPGGCALRRHRLRRRQRLPAGRRQPRRPGGVHAGEGRHIPRRPRPRRGPDTGRGQPAPAVGGAGGAAAASRPVRVAARARQPAATGAERRRMR